MNTDPQPEDTHTPPQKSETPPPPPAATSSPSPPGTSGLSKDSLNLGMLCHLLALCGIIVPFGSILGPLILWLVKKDSDPYVDAQGKESLNFQISVAIYALVCGILTLLVIGIFLLFVLIIGWIVLTIMAVLKVSKGEPWKYPLTIRLIK